MAHGITGWVTVDYLSGYKPPGCHLRIFKDIERRDQYMRECRARRRTTHTSEPKIDETQEKPTEIQGQPEDDPDWELLVGNLGELENVLLKMVNQFNQFLPESDVQEIARIVERTPEPGNHTVMIANLLRVYRVYAQFLSHSLTR
jgi:hypothetical protein